MVKSPKYCFGNFTSVIKHLLLTCSLTFKEANQQAVQYALGHHLFNCLSTLALLAANFIGIEWKELSISRDNAVAGEFKEGKK